jgi:hypothetical protein
MSDRTANVGDVRPPSVSDSRSQRTGGKDGQGYPEVAELIATGAIPFPVADVQSLDHPLVREVRRQRRKRLIRFLASILASDDSPEKGNSS